MICLKMSTRIMQCYNVCFTVLYYRNTRDRASTGPRCKFSSGHQKGLLLMRPIGIVRAVGGGGYALN